MLEQPLHSERRPSTCSRSIRTCRERVQLLHPCASPKPVQLLHPGAPPERVQPLRRRHLVTQKSASPRTEPPGTFSWHKWIAPSLEQIRKACNHQQRSPKHLPVVPVVKTPNQGRARVVTPRCVSRVGSMETNRGAVW